MEIKLSLLGLFFLVSSLQIGKQENVLNTKSFLPINNITDVKDITTNKMSMAETRRNSSQQKCKVDSDCTSTSTPICGISKKMKKPPKLFINKCFMDIHNCLHNDSLKAFPVSACKMNISPPPAMIPARRDEEEIEETTILEPLCKRLACELNYRMREVCAVSPTNMLLPKYFSSVCLMESFNCVYLTDYVTTRHRVCSLQGRRKYMKEKIKNDLNKKIMQGYADEFDSKRLLKEEKTKETFIKFINSQNKVTMSQV